MSARCAPEPVPRLCYRRRTAAARRTSCRIVHRSRSTRPRAHSGSRPRRTAALSGHGLAHHGRRSRPARGPCGHHLQAVRTRRARAAPAAAGPGARGALVRRRHRTANPATGSAISCSAVAAASASRWPVTARVVARGQTAGAGLRHAASLPRRRVCSESGVQCVECPTRFATGGLPGPRRPRRAAPSTRPAPEAGAVSEHEPGRGGRGRAREPPARVHPDPALRRPRDHRLLVGAVGKVSRRSTRRRCRRPSPAAATGARRRRPRRGAPGTPAGCGAGAGRGRRTAAAARTSTCRIVDVAASASARSATTSSTSAAGRTAHPRRTRRTCSGWPRWARRPTCPTGEPARAGGPAPRKGPGHRDVHVLTGTGRCCSRCRSPAPTRRSCP